MPNAPAASLPDIHGNHWTLALRSGRASKEQR